MKEIKFPNLLAEMARRGDNQGTLARLLKNTQAGISRRLSGKTDWQVWEIEKLCEYYGKDYYYLFK